MAAITGDCGRTASATATAARREFDRRKEQILASLDKSPKGSLDAPILEFLSWLNAQPAVVSTSSCSGRIAIFLGAADPSNSKGGDWLLCSHDPVEDVVGAWTTVIEGLRSRGGAGSEALRGTLVTLLLEPFVLHAECGDTITAQQVLETARSVGLRESGLSLGRRRVMVQLRTLALRLEVPLAFDGDLTVNEKYFATLIRLANQRLAENARRTGKLWEALRLSLAAPEEADTREPWVLVCPASLARAVKLAVEERGWMDESRKMVPMPDTVGLGLPVTSAAAEALQEMEDVRDVSEREGPETCTTVEPEASSLVEGKKKKKKPQVVAADLEALWRQGAAGPLKLVKSTSLPSKERPAQRGPGGAAAALSSREREQAAMMEIAQKAIGEGMAGAPIGAFMADIEALGALLWRGDAVLLSRGALADERWVRLAAAYESFWNDVREALGARLLARQQEIRVDSPVRAGAVEMLSVAPGAQEDAWVVVSGPRGVQYCLDITRCMFSEGNAAEKERVSQWNVEGETVLDLYTGIGFWTLPLLAAGAARVYSCEWNPDAVAGLRRGLALLKAEDRCEVLQGDNRRPEVVSATAGRCHRVLLGLIPTSRDGFSVAASALREVGGVLHVHWNVAQDEEAKVAAELAQELEGLFQSFRGAWRCWVEAVQRIKWYAPRVRHVRIDIRCEPCQRPGI